MTNPQQLKYLQAIGIPVWISRELVTTKAVEMKEDKPCADSASSIIDELSQLKRTDIKSKPTVQAEPIKPKVNESIARVNSDCANMDWQTLQQTVAACQLCKLSKTRTQTVFGSGNQQASWMIIGEAPGAEEDRQGQPFVGRAGQLLTNMLRAIGLNREEVYIANILKCRPPNNRDPEPEEAASCNTYLQRQLQLIKPEIVLVVGRVAAQNLLQTKEPLARLRGKVHRIPGSDIPVVVTYHPAYLLRKPDDKRKTWDDLKLAKSII